MEGCGNRVSCRNVFTKLQIVPLTSQYMLSLLMFVVCITARCPYLTCSSVCNYSNIFLCFLVTRWFVPVCIKHHSCIWLGISLFDSRHLYNNVLLLTCSVSYCVFICGFMES